MTADANTRWKDLHGTHFANTRVVITGGAGFIGSHLAEALVTLGASVIVLDDLSNGTRDNISTFGPLQFMQGSIMDRGLVCWAMQGSRYVFHLAAMGSVPRSIEQPAQYHEINTTGTLSVMECAREESVQRVIFASSSSVYGSNAVPWKETMPVLPCSPYAATKAAGEAILRAYAGSYSVDTVSLRYFNIFGPRQNPNSAYAAAIAAFAKALAEGTSPVIYGDGEQSRDFTYVDNAVHATLLAARHAAPLGGQTINGGSGEPITVNQLARAMSAGFGRADLQPVYKPPRAGDLRHSYAALELGKAVLGYSPIVPFAAGLERTIEWYREALG